jgi:transcriptional regulator
LSIAAGASADEPSATGEHANQSAYRTSVFERFTDDDAADLIGEYPLAWVCPQGSGSEDASLLPLLAERDDSGRIVRLIGHMARSNPLVEQLGREPAATILFRGPQGYVSPEMAGRRDWVPTWNFAQLRIRAQVRFQPDATEAAVAMLVNAMEQDRDRPWRVEETGSRYPRMIGAIIAFEAKVLSLRGRFKLGQDETPADLKAIVTNHPNAALVRWMKRFNQGRY